MSEYVRYLTWVLQGKCQICGEFNHGRQMCPRCEDEIDRQIDTEEGELPGAGQATGGGE